MSEEIEHMTEQEIRRSEWGFKAGLLLTGAALICGVVCCVGVLFHR